MHFSAIVLAARQESENFREYWGYIEQGGTFYPELRYWDYHRHAREGSDTRYHAYGEPIETDSIPADFIVDRPYYRWFLDSYGPSTNFDDERLGRVL